MIADIKPEIDQIIKALKDSKKNNLAQQIEKNWDKSCLEYSQNINSYKTTYPLENIMVRALSTELKRLAYTDTQIKAIVSYLGDHRILQTTPHISPAQKPRFFFINWLASLSFKKTDIYPVAMFSGIPFSNKTRPGRLCSKHGDINLIPSNMQDALVYRNSIPEKMIEELGKLPQNLKKILPHARKSESYTKWALESSKKIESKYLGGKPIFFDFNEVVAHYISLAIKDKNHPIYKILFIKEEREQIISAFSNEIFFYGTTKKGKYETMESFQLKDGYLESPTRRILLTPENIAKEIENKLCAGLPLGFLAFTFLNYFKCFGSFAQTEYLPMYKKYFSRIQCLKNYDIANAPTENLTTTGGFPLNLDLYPLDLYSGEKLKADKNMLFGEVIIAIKDVLLHQNYSTNMIK